MRVDIEYYGNRYTCPSCGVSLNIEQTYEEHRSDINGIATCPGCNCKLSILSSIEFIIKKEEK